MKRKLQLGVERKDRAGLAVPTKRSVRLRPHRVAEEEKTIRMRKAWEEAIEKVAENSPFSSKNNPSEPTVLTEGAMGRLQSGSIYRGQHPPENPVIGDMYINALDVQFVYTDEGERDGWHRVAGVEEQEQQQCRGCRYWRRFADPIELGGGVRTTFVFGTCTCNVNLPDGSTTEGVGMHENETGCPNWTASVTQDRTIETRSYQNMRIIRDTADRAAGDIEDMVINGTTSERSVLTPVPTTNGGHYIRHPVSNQILMTDGHGNRQWVDPPQAPDESTVTLRGNGQVPITDRNGNPLPIGNITQVDLTIPEQAPVGQVLGDNDRASWVDVTEISDERLRQQIDAAVGRAQARMDKAIEDTTSEFFAKARVRLLKFVWQFMLVITSIVGVSMYLAEKLT